LPVSRANAARHFLCQEPTKWVDDEIAAHVAVMSSTAGRDLAQLSASTFKTIVFLPTFERSQAAAPYLGVERVTTDAIAHAELADGKCFSIGNIHLSPHLPLPTGIAGSIRWATN
jgi:hypothetical protein